MTEAERIGAAIAKLETLRDSCTPGRWLVDAGSKVEIYYEDGGATILTPEDAYPRGDNHPAENADLVITLHRTIDAQLTILRLEFENLTAIGGWPGHPFAEREAVLALADAILWSDS